MAKYWNPIHIPRLSDHASGIRIKESSDDDFGFHGMDSFTTDAVRALDLIYRTTSGAAVLDNLVHAANDTVTIGPGANMCGAIGAGSRSKVAAELLLTDTAVPGTETKTAVQHLFGDPPEQGLAQAINDCPKLNIQGLPGRYPGWLTSTRLAVNRLLLWSSDSSDGYFNNQLWIKDIGYQSKGNVVSVNQIKSWLTGVNIENTEVRQHVVLSTIVLTYGVSPNGNGSRSWVTWDAGDQEYLLNQRRPPSVALAHELLHAYFNLKGMQPGVESGHFSTVLFEYRCVGLGPWDEADPSENSIRRQWRDAVVVNIPQTELDHRICPKRIRYD